MNETETDPSIDKNLSCVKDSIFKSEEDGLFNK